MKYRKYLILWIMVILSAFIFSCAPKERKPLNRLDTPEHHTSTGIKLLNQGKYNDAKREFQLALQLNPKFSKAYVGSSLVKACQGDVKSAFKAIVKAKTYAKSDKEKVFYHVAGLRLYTMSKKGKDWLEDAENEFKNAIKLDPRSSAAYYFMGVAYKVSLQFKEAARMFSKVLDLNDEYADAADKELKFIRKIQEAAPGTVH
ncbi:MAG: tetratricopeptide repeat protein [Syntrophobacterales bacterium]|nr:tetratricopeptide repeat protein [Syntrophobacterales bacterium]